MTASTPKPQHNAPRPNAPQPNALRPNERGLRVSELSVKHRGAAAAAPVRASFSVQPGEALLIMGPSGCGKSTLAMACTGLIPKAIWAQTRGDVTLSGAPLAELDVPHAAQHVALVMQDADAQIVAGTVYDEVAFAPENFGHPVAEIEARVARALRATGLWERRDDAPETLSGGQRQRLAIAGALAQGAEVLILDEPTANLDPASTAAVYDVLAELLATGDVAIVLVEHNVDQALRIADRVLVLDRDGRMAAHGTPQQVFTEQVALLRELGVWLPVATESALVLQDAGWLAADAQLPVHGDQLRTLLGAAAASITAGLPSMPRTEPVAPAADCPAIEVRSLTVRTGNRTRLDNVSLRIPPASLTAVVGPNGAGKTTLLQAIAGITPPPRGTVQLEGQDAATLRPRALRERLGFVFQNPEHQFLTDTVRDELAIELRAQRLDRAEIQARVDASLDRFDLRELADAHPFTLSGGQKRRLSVAAALISGARILVLDEPTFGQDRARAAELVAMLHELVDDGTTVILATHDLQLVADHCDRVVAISDGRIIADGATGTVLRSPEFARLGIGLPPLAECLADATPAVLREVTRMSALRALVGAPPAGRSGGRA
ncbi:ABC transporter ATP-binding protein [Gulosibacter bifidus]|uniref:ABC transporter ATP-binding protein n=1 Tax=Gulosibacter bifidus TaxID=272239 RepID=A0ABW5RK43_9MICO|nr:energy-coupling factor transporter ATPase [Gulosibacter bifidus]